ncbi:MAG: hypothetical protein ACREGG_03000 [Candidatus Saccharimonadales bacterium]
MELRQDSPLAGESLVFEPEKGEPELRVISGGLALSETVGLSAVEEDRLSPLDLFKKNLHQTVISIESKGESALGYLTGVLDDLKGQEILLSREAFRLEHEAQARGYTQEFFERMAPLEEERVLVYHQNRWAFGYWNDRLPKGKRFDFSKIRSN